MEKIRLCIIEDNPSYVEWLKLEIAEDPRYEILSIDAWARGGIESVKKYQPDIILLDFQLADITGLEAARRIKSHFPDLRILAMTAHTEAPILDRMIYEEDIDGIMIKGSPYVSDNFLAILQCFSEGFAFIDPSLRKHLSQQERKNILQELTPKEFEVFIQTNLGKKVPEIAKDLNLEPATINNIKSRVTKKVSGISARSLMAKLQENMHKNESSPIV